MIVADRTVRTVAVDYFTEIEDHFIARRGTPFVLSSKDQHLVVEWHRAGIPLPIVIEAIDMVFDRFDAKQRKVNGLSFCKDAVKKLWGERRELTVGSGEAVPEEDPTARLAELATALPAAYAERVRALRGSVPQIEEQLMSLEGALLGELLIQAPELRAEAEALVGAGDEKTRARSVEAHLRRLVRERFGLPRLSLF